MVSIAFRLMRPSGQESGVEWSVVEKFLGRLNCLSADAAFGTYAF